MTARAVALVALLVLVSCSRPVTSQVSSTGIPVASASAIVRFIVDPANSSVEIRVREQLAALPSMSDAILSTKKISGEIGLSPDGRITASSLLTVDLDSLESDEARRDNFIKQNTLETHRFPSAELKVLRTAGLAIPVPRSGEFQFTLISTVLVHGVEHDVAWAVTATRAGRELKATATTTVHFADFGMERPSVALVLSVQDDIRVSVKLRAEQA
ncbi:MAG TPA: YceI family protein [Candidatus Limnocylindria bacterium]|nr:YceI family protein [Candidatus Limnocylindria bacterium]